MIFNNINDKESLVILYIFLKPLNNLWLALFNIYITIQFLNNFSHFKKQKKLSYDCRYLGLVLMF
jgi:hypothetical protein